MYDIFFLGSADTSWDVVKSKYSNAQRLEKNTAFDDIRKKSFTKLFWVIWDDVVLDTAFNLNEYKTTQWDNMYIHVFKNGDNFDGICLFPKNITVSKREFYHRFFANKKEIDIVASVPKRYNRYSPQTFEEYMQIDDDVFWCIWPEIVVTDNKVFDLYFSHHNSYDRRENHMFKNLCNDTDSYLNGIVLCSKYKKISKKEFEKRYIIDKKEHNILASKFQYPKYAINSYEEYLDILNSEPQKMFWGIWPEIDIIDQSVFDLYFDPNDGKYDHDRNENHTFKHQFNNTVISVNGVVLFSKEKSISRREFTHRFLIEKKEHDIMASSHRLYDVVFISYNESNADENYNKLISKCPRAKRVHGIKGIHNAHIRAAELCSTDMIWVVDGDAVIEDDFNFNLVMSSYDIDCVHVWRSRNPINDLVYGNGGVKLLPRHLTLNIDVNSPDMTTSISKKFKAVQEISNITAFNTDEFTTWRSAFRECAKLSSRVIDRQHEEETQQRLGTWCTAGVERKFGKYAIAGARSGKTYGLINKSNADALRMINNFDWLKEQFEKTYVG